VARAGRAGRRGAVAALAVALALGAACGQGRGDEAEGPASLVSTGLSHSRQGGDRGAPPSPRDPRPPPAAVVGPAESPPELASPVGPDSPAPLPDAAALPPLVPLRGAAAHDDPIGDAAAGLLERSQAVNWSRDGTLTQSDLTIRLRTVVTDGRGGVAGEAGFNLDVVHGFRGLPKCNLLAFEIAYRAGFVVPLIGRSVGWGFPSSEMIADDARDFDIVGDWARVRRRPVASEVNLDRDNGVGFMAVARASLYGRFGHVAIIDWVEDLALTSQGDIRVLSFMGWEANGTEGARYRRITFTTTDTNPSSRFDYVFLLELRAAEPGNEVAMIGSGPRNPTEVFNLEGSPTADAGQ
jgi:hypothetical protein